LNTKTGRITASKEAVASTAVYLGFIPKDLNLLFDQINGLNIKLIILRKFPQRPLMVFIGVQVFLVKMK